MSVSKRAEWKSMGHNVAEEASVVDDAYLMGAFLISKHAHPTFEIVDPDFDVGMPPKSGNGIFFPVS
jgi:hypothetical protein